MVNLPVQWGTVWSFQQMVLAQLGIHMQSNDVKPLPHPYTKINSEWIIDLHMLKL